MINPCKGICTIENGQCIGCKRTTDEIRNWWEYGDDEQERIADELEDRELVKPKRRSPMERRGVRRIRRFDEDN